MHRHFKYAVIAVASTFNVYANDTEVLVVEVYATREQPNLGLDAPSAIGSRLKLTTRDTPASVESVDAATILERGDFNVRDAITRTTGLSDISTPGDGGVAYSARGFTGNNSIGVLIDGQRMMVGAGTITDPTSTWGYERIEVLRGAGSVINGAGTTGATINAIRKAPLAEFTIDALVGVGAGGTFRAGIGGTGTLGAAGAFRVDAYTESSDGFIDRGDSKSNKIMSSFRFDPRNDLRFKFQLDHSDQKPIRYFGTPVINGGIDSSLRERKISDEVTHFEANRHWRDAETYAYNAGTNQIDRSDYIEIRHIQQQTGNRLVAGWEISAIDFRRDSNAPFGGASSVALQDFNPGVFSSPDPTLPGFRSRTLAQAFYAEDAYDLTERLLLVAGLRYDGYRYSNTSLLNGSSFNTNLNSNALRLGLTYRLNPTTSLYAQASTGSDPISSLLSLNLPNSKFELTKARQVEAGVKQGFAEGRGEWTAALYRIVKDNIITRDPGNPALSIQGGNQSSRGAEFPTSYVVGRGWRIDGNLALVDAQFDELINGAGTSFAGKRPPNVASQVANLWLNYGIATWGCGIGARYVGKSHADNANTIVLLAYTVLDASVAWHKDRNTTLGAILRNLGDRVYATTAYTGTQFMLGDPRRVELTAEFRF